jgi:hypothetical protein
LCFWLQLLFYCHHGFLCHCSCRHFCFCCCHRCSIFVVIPVIPVSLFLLSSL